VPLYSNLSFRDRVHSIVRAVPKGRVVTYGQVALLAGRPRSAREVGWIAHAGGHGIPWQRVVNRQGGLASGYTGGPAGQKRALQRDGVRVGPDGRVDLQRYRWWPSGRQHNLAEVLARFEDTVGFSYLPQRQHRVNNRR
jgi:methylated-DNA-protein-cysteine methyltransferase-like protein